MGELPAQLLSVLQQRIKAGLIAVKEMESACPSICAYSELWSICLSLIYLCRLLTTVDLDILGA